MSAAPDPILDILPIRYSVERTLAQPGFWLGLCAARDPRNPDDHRLIAGYERIADVLRADPDCKLATIPEAAAWLERRMRLAQEVQP